jgi:hypothetical protein
MNRRLGSCAAVVIVTSLGTISSTLAQDPPPRASFSPDETISVFKGADIPLPPPTPARPQHEVSLQHHEVSLQHFVCSRGYTVERCYQDVALLRQTLAKYPLSQIREWTWILVRSEDWKAIVLPRGLDPDSPAFTYSAKRQTFIEEALVADVPWRGDELRARWHMQADKLRDLVAAHELGHALCKDRSETIANQQAERFQHGKSPSCELNPDPNILAEETRKPRLHAK